MIRIQYTSIENPLLKDIPVHVYQAYPKELLYEASITIDSSEKLVIYLNNALTEKAIEVLE